MRGQNLGSFRPSEPSDMRSGEVLQTPPITARRGIDRTATMRQRRHQDAFASIDEELDEARRNIDWERRNHAEESLRNWIMTYGLGVYIDDQPSDRLFEILDRMEIGIKEKKNTLLSIFRSGGKSSFAIACAMYAISKGLRSFVMFIGANARAAQSLLNDLYRIINGSDAFAQDYPDIALPHLIANGSFRRR